MVKEMRIDLNPSSLHKRHHVFVKFAVSFLLLGLAFRLFVSDSIRFSSSVVETPPLVDTNSITESPPLSSSSSSSSSLPAQAPSSGDLLANESQAFPNVAAECDIFTGDWVPDPSAPAYTNASCHEIEGHQNCMRNGRPDSGYLYWRWNPRDCELPRFDPGKFLDSMRNKSWAFIGDSISRNHVQSLLCILSQVEQAVEVYHDEEYRSKRWHFPSHNFTLSVVWTPFLLKAYIFEDINGVSSSEIQLHLDKLDETWTEQFKNFDYAVIAGGKWFLKTAIYHENDTVTGCHYCPGKNFTELGFDYAYRRALKTVLNFLTNSGHKAFIFLRTTTPDHFENGEWFSGGTCNRTAPFKDGEVDMKDVDIVMRDIELEEYEKAAPVGAESGVILKLLYTTRLSLLRPDGHPGPYRQYQPFTKDKNTQVQNDCLHWCLPGPIDSWNDLLMEMINRGIHQ
ncbi:protein trichome birefringence-like 25 isoform X1 [Herrania umbratica]|uniref:Protein trichome birefringence-like 25 isoform X1 n=1 Tax=Herrania umbratica TaxID=108875 RepID=A0A6J0ZZV2_9ROSI|nr:protein trichome birefringence-like 25 isoform X1 [Herrania umbratica]